MERGTVMLVLEAAGPEPATSDVGGLATNTIMGVEVVVAEVEVEATWLWRAGEGATPALVRGEEARLVLAIVVRVKTGGTSLLLLLLLALVTAAGAGISTSCVPAGLPSWPGAHHINIKM